MSLCWIGKLLFISFELSFQNTRAEQVPNMLMLISEAFINDKEIEHCGILLFREHDPRNPDNPVLYFLLKDPEGAYYSHRFSLTNIAQVFSFSKANIFGFVFDKTSIYTVLNVKFRKKNALKSTYKFLTIYMPPPPKYIIHSSVPCLKDFLVDSITPTILALQIFEALQPSIKSESEQEAEISKETTEVVKYADELYLNFLQVYVAFIKNNKQTDPKKCKEIIKSLEDVPKFAKSLEMDDEDILNLLGRFVSEHICQHPDCDGFSYLKCGDCKDVHYCNVQCQEKDFSIHQHQCKIQKSTRLRTWIIPDYLKKTHEQIYQKPVISFETFIRVLSVKIYEAFHDTLRKTALGQFIVHNITENTEHKSDEKMLGLLKKRKNGRIPFKCLKIQMENAFGNRNLLAQFLSSPEQQLCQLLINTRPDFVINTENKNKCA